MADIKTLSDLIQKNAFYSSGGTDPGQSPGERFSKGFDTASSIGNQYLGVIDDVLKQKKLKLENAGLQQGQTSVADTVGQTNFPNLPKETQVLGNVPMNEFSKFAGGIKAMRPAASPDVLPVSALPEEAKKRALAAGFQEDGTIDLKKFNALKTTDPFAPVNVTTPPKAVEAGTVPGNTKIVDPTLGNTRGLNAETKIRQEFINRPEVKDYQAVNTSVKSMDSLLKSAMAGDANNQVALDQGLITLFNKETDPASVVRESEYARTPENLPITNRFAGALQKLATGGAGMTNEDRQALILGAKIIAKERGKTFNATRRGYVNISNKSGIEPELVVGTLPEFQDSQYDAPVSTGAATSVMFPNDSAKQARYEAWKAANPK